MNTFIAEQLQQLRGRNEVEPHGLEDVIEILTRSPEPYRDLARASSTRVLITCFRRLPEENGGRRQMMQLLTRIVESTSRFPDDWHYTELNDILLHHSQGCLLETLQLIDNLSLDLNSRRRMITAGIHRSVNLIVSRLQLPLDVVSRALQVLVGMASRERNEVDRTHYNAIAGLDWFTSFVEAEYEWLRGELPGAERAGQHMRHSEVLRMFDKHLHPRRDLRRNWAKLLLTLLEDNEQIRYAMSQGEDFFVSFELIAKDPDCFDYLLTVLSKVVQAVDAAIVGIPISSWIMRSKLTETIVETLPELPTHQRISATRHLNALIATIQSTLVDGQANDDQQRAAIYEYFRRISDRL